MSVLLLFWEGGGGSDTPVVQKSPILILLTSGRVAMRTGAKVYQPL